MGEIGAAYRMGLRPGPVRLEFTNYRFLAIPTLSSGPTSLFSGYKEWRAAVPPGPASRLLNIPYTLPDGSEAFELPISEVGQIRVSREIGLWIDRSVTDLIVSNLRRGFSIGAGANAKPGLGARSPGVLPEQIYRVPEPVESLRAFLQQTPFASVLLGP